MAAFFARGDFLFIRYRSIFSCRKFSTGLLISKNHKRKLLLLSVASGLAAWQIWERRKKPLNRSGLGLIPILHATKEEDEKRKHPSTREIRFREFASVEYEGQTYMTPRDFLESVTEENPRSRIGRAKVTKAQVDLMLKDTPPRCKGSGKLFGGLHNNGIISYTEYLFLLCVLTKPQSGFRIAFNMFDTDGNQIVDKREFLVLEHFFILPPHERSLTPQTPGSMSLRDEHVVNDTTLLVHFFGLKGKDALKYEDFYRFMENLQSEVIELEFMEFSKGMATISEVDFAKIILRYTMLDDIEIEECISRVRERIPKEKGITLKEFQEFCHFLNNLDDFSISMKMFTYAQRAVSQEDFQRAAKICTGYTLGPNIVNTVFQIFDADGDGHLSHKEFISIMKDRLHRGAKSHLIRQQGIWDSFKMCVKGEMKAY